MMPDSVSPSVDGPSVSKPRAQGAWVRGRKPPAFEKGPDGEGFSRPPRLSGRDEEEPLVLGMVPVSDNRLWMGAILQDFRKSVNRVSDDEGEDGDSGRTCS